MSVFNGGGFDENNVSPGELSDGLAGKLNTPTVGVRAAVLGTAYQPSLTRPSLVIASVSISTGAAGSGKVELMIDSANPPTTVCDTRSVATALTNTTGNLVGIVPAGHYYKLEDTAVAGTPTFGVVGNVQEILL